MNRGLLWVAVLAAAGQTGCSSARYVQRGPDEGIVAIPDQTNAWPAYNRDKAVELIKEHVGSDYEIVEEWADKSGDQPAQRPVPTRDVSTNNQLYFLPQTPPRGNTGSQQADATEWRIRYRRRSIGGANPDTLTAAAKPTSPVAMAAPSGTGGLVMPASFQQAASIPPLVLPPSGVVQAGLQQGAVIPLPVLPAAK